MSGKLFELGGPSWINGPMGFEIPAHPIKKVTTSAAPGDFDGVMNGADADSVFGQLVQLVEMLQRHVLIAAVAIHDDGIDAIERFEVAGPTALCDGCFDGQTTFVQAFG